MIENKAGETSHMFETIVNSDAPKLVQALPQTLKIEEHKPAELTVKFVSPSESKVTWSANNVTLEDSPKYKISSTKEETTLRIADVIKDDTEMVYCCKVSNIGGQVSTTTSLTLPCKLNHTILTFTDMQNYEL